MSGWRIWRRFGLGLATFIALGWANRADATFHFMQIEQVIGSVNGDLTAQAIQLRMRTAGQNLVSSSRIRVWDAAGQNPIIVINMTTNVAIGTAGSRVLIVSPNFPATTTPATVSNFTMTSLIPASYLNAGSLTFEDDAGTIYWRLSWGGGCYTGSNLGSITNDADGNFGPPFPSPLPCIGARPLRFPGLASAPSTNNAADYTIITSGPIAVVNNAGTSFTVNVASGGDSDGDNVGDSCDLCPNNNPALPVDSRGRPRRDTNNDCLVNADDIPVIVNELISILLPAVDCSGQKLRDANNDGQVNGLDIPIIVAEMLS